MFKFGFLSATLALLGAMGSAGAAQAGSYSASASLDNIHFQLIDLDPNDGITPSFTLERVDVPWEAVGSSASVSLGGPLHDRQEWLNPFVPVAARYDLGRAYATASASGGIALNSWSFNASAAYPYDTAANGFSAEALVFSRFLLSANTQLILTGWSRVATSNAFHPELASQEQSASSGMYLSVAPSGDEEAIWREAANRLNSAYYQQQPNPTQAFGDAELASEVSLSLENRRSDVMDGTLYFNVSARGASTPVVTSPVPEPSGYLLFAGGLGLLAVGARRRRACRS